MMVNQLMKEFFHIHLFFTDIRRGYTQAYICLSIGQWENPQIAGKYFRKKMKLDKILFVKTCYVFKILPETRAVMIFFYRMRNCFFIDNRLRAVCAYDHFCEIISFISFNNYLLIIKGHIGNSRLRKEFYLRKKSKLFV